MSMVCVTLRKYFQVKEGKISFVHRDISNIIILKMEGHNGKVWPF